MVSLAKSVRASVRLFGTTSRQFKNLFRVLQEPHVDKTTNDYQLNEKHNLELLDKLKQLTDLAIDGGGEANREKHTKRNKKLLVSDRLKNLFDDYDDVLEVGALAGLAMPYGNVPRAGIVTAIGTINGVHCMVGANDATVKGGTMYPIGVRKNLRAMEISRQNFIPSIYVTDSGGAFLPLQADIFTLGGRTFYEEAIINSLDIPQLCLVVGSCTAGGAYIPTMTQEAVIVDRIGHIFLGGPPLVYAALGEKVTPDDLGGGVLHSSVSGCVDHYTTTEPEAFEIARDAVIAFNLPKFEAPTDFEPPLYDMEDIYGLLPKEDCHQLDMYKVISRLVDGSRMHEFKKDYGTELITGFAHLQGYLVGLVANNGPLTDTASVKGSHFVQLCDQRRVPIIFLQNSYPDSSLMSSYQGDPEGLARSTKDLGKLMHAVACSTVPKLTLVIGNSFGASNYAMCGRSFEPRFLFSWPNAQFCIAAPSDVAAQLDADEAGDGPDMKQKVIQGMNETSSAFYASAHGWDDGVIEPTQSRKVLGRCLTVIHQGQLFEASRLQRGVMRM